MNNVVCIRMRRSHGIISRRELYPICVFETGVFNTFAINPNIFYFNLYETFEIPMSSAFDTSLSQIPTYRA